MALKLVFAIFILCPYVISSVKGDCQKEITKELTKEFQPVYIDPIEKKFMEPILVTSGGFKDVIFIEENMQLNLWCSEGWQNLKSAPKLISTTCKGGKLEYNGYLQDINEYKCKKWSKITYKKTSTKCYESGTLIDVGFQITNKFWLNIYTVCFDPILQRTHYTHYNMYHSSSQGGIEDPYWEQTNFFSNKNVNNLYTIESQLKTISATFDDPQAANYFIDKKNAYFLSRGHLAAKSDFIYATQQRSTFHFINVAPQWQSFNGGNWDIVEKWSKNAAKAHKGLDVYTGTFEILSLNYNSASKSIFLGSATKNPLRSLWNVISRPFLSKSKKISNLLLNFT